MYTYTIASLLLCSTASWVLYNRTERGRGFIICSSKLNLKNIAEHNLGTFSINSPRKYIPTNQEAYT